MTEITPEMYFQNFCDYHGDLNFFTRPFVKSDVLDGLRLREKIRIFNFLKECSDNCVSWSIFALKSFLIGFKSKEMREN